MYGTVPKNFSQSPILFKLLNGSTAEAMQYTYESKNHLYDVVKFRGGLLVRKNCGPLSPFICDWSAIHYAIQVHFNLEEDESIIEEPSP